MNYKILATVLLLTSLSFATKSFGQCCAGGSGSPIVGASSMSVLQKNQIELNTNFQYIQTDQFYFGDQLSSSSTFDSYSSIYEYFKLSYGLTKRLTMSIESGYYINKKEIGKDNDEVSSYESQGFGDLILFPRYSVFNISGSNSKTELSLGLGIKIPLGGYNDEKAWIEPFSGQTYYTVKPTAVQLSSGATDIIYYTLIAHSFIKQKLRVFANGLFIRKGFNPNGEKLGDFGSFSISVSKTFYRYFQLSFQSRYEWTDQMIINEEILMFGRPSNYSPNATGYKKFFVVPQITYSRNDFSIYVSTDLPIYQFLNSDPNYTQIGSQFQTTIGISYRFFVKKKCVE